MEKEIREMDTPRIKEIRKRAEQVREVAVKGLLELEQLEAELEAELEVLRKEVK